MYDLLILQNLILLEQSLGIDGGMYIQPFISINLLKISHTTRAIFIIIKQIQPFNTPVDRHLRHV